MLIDALSDIPTEVREREDVQSFTDAQWERFAEVHNAVWASNDQMDDGDRGSLAQEVAIDRAKAVEASKHLEAGWTPTWVRAISTGTLHLDDRTVEITRDVLSAVASEYSRYLRDLDAAGEDYTSPVTRPGPGGPHVDSGRRDGDIIDAVHGGDVLYAAVDWREATEEDITDEFLDGLSVNIRAEYTDSGLGITYSPHLLEISPTNHPRDKSAGVAASLNGLAASELDAMGFEVAADETAGALPDQSSDDDKPENDSTPTTEGPHMQFSKWFRKNLNDHAAPEGGGLGYTRAEIIQTVASEAGVDVEVVQQAAKGEIVFPPDAVLEASAKAFGADADGLRAGEFDAEPADDTNAPSPTPEIKGDSEGDEPEDVEASDGAPEWAHQLQQEVESLREENQQLKQDIELARRLSSQANTGKQSSAGTGIQANDGPSGGGITGTESLTPNTYEATGKSAIAAAEAELSEEFTDDEVTVYAMFKDPAAPKTDLPDDLESKVRKHQ